MVGNLRKPERSRDLDFRRARILRRPQHRSGECTLRLVLPRIPQQSAGGKTGSGRMKPEVDQILSVSAGQLLAGAVPLLPNSYAQGATSVTAFLMLFSAQEYERGAEIRVRENSDMRAVFKELSS